MATVRPPLDRPVRPYADWMSVGPYPLGVAVTWGLPVASTTTMAWQPAVPGTGLAQTCAARWVDAVEAAVGWAIAEVAPTVSIRAPTAAARDRAERFTGPPGWVRRSAQRLRGSATRSSRPPNLTGAAFRTLRPAG